MAPRKKLLLLKLRLLRLQPRLLLPLPLTLLLPHQLLLTLLLLLLTLLLLLPSNSLLASNKKADASRLFCFTPRFCSNNFTPIQTFCLGRNPDPAGITAQHLTERRHGK